MGEGDFPSVHRKAADSLNSAMRSPAPYTWPSSSHIGTRRDRRLTDSSACTYKKRSKHTRVRLSQYACSCHPQRQTLPVCSNGRVSMTVWLSFPCLCLSDTCQVCVHVCTSAFRHNCSRCRLSYVCVCVFSVQTCSSSAVPGAQSLVPLSAASLSTLCTHTHTHTQAFFRPLS